jgi:hypothetical protein
MYIKPFPKLPHCPQADQNGRSRPAMSELGNPLTSRVRETDRKKRYRDAFNKESTNNLSEVHTRVQ